MIESTISSTTFRRTIMQGVDASLRAVEGVEYFGSSSGSSRASTMPTSGLLKGLRSSHNRSGQA